MLKNLREGHLIHRPVVAPKLFLKLRDRFLPFDKPHSELFAQMLSYQQSLEVRRRKYQIIGILLLGVIVEKRQGIPVDHHMLSQTMEIRLREEIRLLPAKERHLRYGSLRREGYQVGYLPDLRFEVLVRRKVVWEASY